jgi:hypothetical protein
LRPQTSGILSFVSIPGSNDFNPERVLAFA